MIHLHLRNGRTEIFVGGVHNSDAQLLVIGQTLRNADNNFIFELCPAPDSPKPSGQQLFFGDDERFMQCGGFG